MILCETCEEIREQQPFGTCDACWHYDDSEEYQGHD